MNYLFFIFQTFIKELLEKAAKIKPGHSIINLYYNFYVVSDEW